MKVPGQVMINSDVSAALIGHGISASLTPAMHEAEGRAQGMSYRYEIFDTNAEPFASMTLEQMLDKAEADGYAGLNITHPFKLDAVGLLDDLSDNARTIGAVNTIVFGDGTRVGHNTDYIGFKSALLAEMGDTAEQQVLLLGAGGAGAAVGLALIDAGVEKLFLFDQNLNATETLAKRLGCARPDVELSLLRTLDAVEFEQLDGVVNATPMGMIDCPGAAVDAGRLNPRTWVADIVYLPLETALLRQAKLHGCPVMDGSGMVIHQAAAAFALITGHSVEIDRFSRVAQQFLSERRATERDESNDTEN